MKVELHETFQIYSTIFPWILPEGTVNNISECARMQVQFQGGNKMRVSTINNRNTFMHCVPTQAYAKSALHYDKLI